MPKIVSDLRMNKNENNRSIIFRLPVVVVVIVEEEVEEIFAIKVVQAFNKCFDLSLHK